MKRMMKQRGFNGLSEEEQAKERAKLDALDPLSSKPPTPTPASRAKFISERSKRFLPPQAFGPGGSAPDHDYNFDEEKAAAAAAAAEEAARLSSLTRSKLSSSAKNDQDLNQFVSSLNIRKNLPGPLSGVGGGAAAGGASGSTKAAGGTRGGGKSIVVLSKTK